MNELVKVQFGCGATQLAGWFNHDKEVDVTGPLPYADESVDIVCAEHLAEHLEGPQCLRFFEEVRRILKPGGIFRVCVPVITTHITREHARDLIANHKHKIAFNEALLVAFLWAAGFDGDDIHWGPRKGTDRHFVGIGLERDDLQTVRLEAVKIA